MTTVTNPKTGNQTLVMACRVCNALVYFGFTANGRRCPFDVIDGQPTEISHFTSCPRVSDWRNDHPKSKADGKA